MRNLPGFGVQVVENLSQEVPVDPSVQTVLQEHALVAITGRDHAAIHEVELDEVRVGQVQVNRHQLTAASLHKKSPSHTKSHTFQEYYMATTSLHI